jgi:two-component system sensor histidine kinase BaeS
MNSFFKSMRSRLIASHIMLAVLCVLSLSAGFVYFMRTYFNEFLINLQKILDNNRGQVPKGQIISRLDIALEYVHLMDVGIFIGAIISFSAAVIIGVFMANRLSKPLRMFTSAIHHLKDNKYAQIQADFTGELAELKTAYNGLSDNLQELQTIRKYLITNVSHELKTPLTALQGYIEGLEDGLIHFDKKMTADMGTEILRLKNLVNDFETSTLDYEAVLQPTSVNVHEFFNDFYNFFLPVVVDQDIQLAVNHDKEKYQAVFDPDRMKQLLIILVENSIKFTPHGGKISISYYRMNHQLNILVEDTGCGIPENDLPFIFERFYRGEKSRSRKTGGTGIGLSIAREIVRAHGGQINALSQVGKGTVFMFSLPIK